MGKQVSFVVDPPMRPMLRHRWKAPDGRYGVIPQWQVEDFLEALEGDVDVVLAYPCRGVTRVEVRDDRITYMEPAEWCATTVMPVHRWHESPCDGGAPAAYEHVRALEDELERHKGRADELLRQIIQLREQGGPQKPSGLPEDIQLLVDLDALRSRLHAFLGQAAWRQVQDAFEPVRQTVLVTGGPQS